MNNQKQSITADEARRAYFKEWRRKNKDRIKKYNKQYWERRAKKEKSINKRYSK